MNRPTFLTRTQRLGLLARDALSFIGTVTAGLCASMLVAGVAAGFLRLIGVVW